MVPAPEGVRTWAINTTAVRVEWKAAQAAENLTRGYLILLESPNLQVRTNQHGLSKY